MKKEIKRAIKDISLSFNRERINDMLEELWEKEFGSDYSYTHPPSNPNVCPHCTRTPKKLYSYTGFIMPTLFVNKQLVCGKCLSLLSEKNAENYLATERFYLTAITNVKNEAIETCFIYQSWKDTLHTEKLAHSIKTSVREALDDYLLPSVNREKSERN